jgi:thermitase
MMDYSKSILRLPEAWKTSQGSREVIVAVVDTGVQVDHPDLKNNIWVNEAELNGRPGVDDDGDGYVDDVYGWDFVNNRPNAIDDNKHGTHCSGIIGAELNGQGTVGVSPLVKIMPLKFLDSSGSGDTANAISAINYAVAHGAKVISNSWGGGGESSLLNEAIQNAIAKGVVVVAAAGNASSNNDTVGSFPANYPGVLAVASTDSADKLSSFSNYGPGKTFIAAPGSNIYSTVIGSSYAYLSGTSMATPQVSGALALALSVRPAATAAELKQALCDSSKKILLDKVQCGRMDVADLLSRL